MVLAWHNRNGASAACVVLAISRLLTHNGTQRSGLAPSPGNSRRRCAKMPATLINEVEQHRGRVRSPAAIHPYRVNPRELGDLGYVYAYRRIYLGR
ncbi:hypothetical protein VTJ04DRAFT_3317 [Mycothermus thermophilus]|uniref:uncharacterized protein n=1 Tax=Humicola insolens TaxID=85995 RepID=UPI0037427117